MFYKYQLARSHINDNKVLEVKNTTLNKSKLKRNFNVMVLPKDVIEMIRHINYYFKDIKNKLVFDDVTGFYLMDVETEDGKKTKLPIMCRHIFMTLSGKSLYQISKECCVNGQCKYCGDSMISFADDDSTNIPPSIAELAYRLIECSDSADDVEQRAVPSSQPVFFDCYSARAFCVQQNSRNDIQYIFSDHQFNFAVQRCSGCWAYRIRTGLQYLLKRADHVLCIQEITYSSQFSQGRKGNTERNTGIFVFCFSRRDGKHPVLGNR
jgi:hypothetical protein